MRTRVTDNLKSGFYFTGGIALLLRALLFRPFAIVNAGERVLSCDLAKFRIPSSMRAYTQSQLWHRLKDSTRVQKNFNADASKDLQKCQNSQSTGTLIRHAWTRFSTSWDEEQIVSGIITPAVSEVLKAATANKTAEQIITKRAELKQRLITIKTRLAAYGVMVDDVSLVNFFSPEFSSYWSETDSWARG